MDATTPQTSRARRLGVGAFASLVLLVAALLVAPASAQSSPPAGTLLSAPLVSPSTAWAFYGGGTAHTNGSAAWTQTPPEIAALARSLGANRLPEAQYARNVFDYVRRNIATEFRFELGKGARGAIIDQSGTPFDQAELMIKLLRAGGVAASYQVGTITLSGDQFGRWTGLVRNLNPMTQAFDVDAASACQLLADGGIPATVNGSSMCVGLTGNLGAVTMGHVWVSANGNLYDPAYKPQIFSSGIDLAVAMGCGSDAAPTCGTNVRVAMLTGAISGTYATGAPFRQNLNESAAMAQLTARAVSLQNAIAASNRFATLADIVGGGVLDASYAPAVGPALPYPSSVQFSWPGEVPDAFRVRVQLTSPCAPVTLFADEMSGRRVRNNGNSIGVWADHIVVTSCATGVGSPAIAIDHPYAANSGTYADEAIAGSGVLIVVQLGEATESTPDYSGRITVAAPTYFIGQAGSTNGCNDPAAQERDSGSCRRDHLPQMAAAILHQQSELARIASAVNRTSITQHHRIGFIQIKRPGPRSEDSIEERINIAGAVSIQSVVASSTGRQAAFRSWAYTSSLAEGVVAQQMNDLWIPQSGALTFVHANRGGQKIIHAPSGSMPAVIAALPIGAYNSADRTTLSSFAAAGYDVIFPERQSTCIAPQGAGCPISPQFAFRPNSLALLVGLSYKGAGSFDPLATLGGGQPPVQRSDSQVRGAVEGASGDFALTPLLDIVTGVGTFPYSLSFQRYYRSGADTREASGNVRLTRPPAGVLTAWNYVGPDSASFARLGGGWTHNFQITAQLGSEARRGLGRESAIEASGAIAGVYALSNLLQNPSFDDWMAASFADYWTSQQLFNNIVIVQRGNARLEFVRLPDGRFSPPSGLPDQLVQSGTATQDWIGYITPINNYRNVAFDLTAGDGSVIHFDWAAETSRFLLGPRVALPLFKATQWSFPSGVRVNFSYTFQTGFKFDDTNATPNTRSPLDRYVLTSVSNSLGRSLTFTLQDSGVQFGGDIGWRINAVRDETNRQVTFARSNCPAFFSNNGGGNPLDTSQSSSLRAQAFLNCNTLTVTAPDGAQTRYDYTAGAFSPDPSFLTRANYRLRRWYSPRSATIAQQTIAYDDAFQTRSVTDALGRSSQHFAAGIMGSERHKRAEAIDANGAVTLITYDQFNNERSVTNPLGHTTQLEYDNANRLVRTVNPEGDSVEQAYDVRSNVIQVIRRPKPGSSLAPIQVTTAYAEGPTVFVCANPRTCNRPVTEDGPRTDVVDITNYSWNATYGDLSQALEPADGAGVRPQTDFAYGVFGSAGNQFRLPTSRTERIAGTQNLVTTYGYNAANRFVLATVTIDPAGLAIARSITYDGVGNATSINGPRQDVTDVTNYVWDANRRLTRRIDPQPVAASATRPAIRFTYAPDGLLTTTERGSTTVADAATMSVLDTVTHLYDDAGNRIRTTTPVGVTQFSYDGLDRTRCVATRMNPAVYGALPADACALSTAGAFGADRITRYAYDEAGQLLTEERGVGTPRAQTFARYTYTPNGQRASIADALNNLSTYVPDGFDRLAELHFPMPTPGANQSNPDDYEAFTYDAANNQTSVRIRSGEQLTYSFDALNRETLKDIPGSATLDVYSTYDLLGRRTSARFGSPTGQGVVSSFDVAGRPTSMSTFGRTLTFTHDGAGNRTRLAWSDDGFFVDYRYDALNRLDLVGENGIFTGASLLADYSYDILSRRTTIGRGNGTSTTYAYDGASRIGALAHDLAGAADDQSWGFSYSPASQITQRTAVNDAYNWQTANAERSYVANGLNQYASVSGTSYAYDLRANLVSDGSRVFCYDLENRLLGVANASGNACANPTTLALAYDPLGRLNETNGAGVVTRFLYDGDQLVGEYDAAGALMRRYVHAPAAADQPIVWYQGGERRYLISDYLGSVVAESGATTTRYAYGPHGEPNVWLGSRFRYTGQVALPEAQLYHYRARVYDPGLGRFLQTDPVGYDAGPNLYAYSANDPVNRLDPDGRDSIVAHFRDQPIHYPRDAPFVGGDKIPQGISNGHRGVVVIDEQSGLTRYREFGRYGGDSQVRALRVPNLVFENGVPTEGSVRALLSRILDIGEAADSTNVYITFDPGTDFQAMMTYIERVQQADPEWEALGTNCHSFCRGVTQAGGGHGPRFRTRLNRADLATSVRRIIRAYEQERERRERERREEEERCRDNPTHCNSGNVRR